MRQDAPCILLLEAWPVLSAALVAGKFKSDAPSLALCCSRGRRLSISQLPHLAGIAPAAADTADSPAGGLEYLLAVLYALPYRGGAGLAAVQRRFDLPALAGDDWCRVDPVILRDAPGRIYLTDPEPQLPAALAAALAADLKSAFGEYGMEFHALIDSGVIRGYLKMTAETWNLPPPGAMLGADLGSVWPEGTKTRPWRALFNDMQMRLHVQPALAARRAANTACPNALWWWGGGPIPSPPALGYRLSGTVPPLARALSFYSKQEGGGAAGELHFWRPKPQVAPPAQLAALEQLVAGKLAALAAGRFGSLALLLDDGRCWHYSRRDRWRFWRRPQLPAGGASC